MGGFDAFYFYSANAAVTHQGLTTVQLGPHELISFEAIVAAGLARIPDLPMLRRRVVHVPLALHHPVWVTVATIDPGYHFIYHDLGGAGTVRDLEELGGRVIAEPLDERHPLWKLHYCEGFADGRTAVMLTAHHAFSDGVGMNALFDSILDVPLFGDRPAHQARDVAAAPLGRASLLLRALADRFVELPRLPVLIGRTLLGLVRSSVYRRQHQARVPKPLIDSPPLPFHGAMTATRRITSVALPLADFTTIRRSNPGVTLNDVLLTVVAGAVRRWMDAHDVRPAKSLTCNVLVSLDAPEDQRRHGGNLISQVFATLATDTDDPATRLTTIATSMKHAKAMNLRRGPTMMLDLFQYLPGGLLKLGLAARAALRLPSPPPFSLTVSNMRGPREQAVVGTVPVLDVKMVGPLVPGIGMSATAYSYQDRVNLSLIACPDLFGDLDELATYVRPALTELLAAVSIS